jgi:hypothetical protein
VPPTPVPPPRRTPRKRTVEPSKGGTTICPAPAQDSAVTLGQQGASPPSSPALCSHPRYYAAIPGTVASSPVPWEPWMMGHRHTRRCASSSPPSASVRRWNHISSLFFIVRQFVGAKEESVGASHLSYFLLILLFLLLILSCKKNINYMFKITTLNI